MTTGGAKSPRRENADIHEHARESFYESTISKLVANKANKPDGPLASIIQGIRSSIEDKSSFDCENILKQVSQPALVYR